jgi:hypothetical protein
MIRIFFEEYKMSPTHEQVFAGQAVYTKRNLAFYDFFILGISSNIIWNCPSVRIRAHYDNHITSNHLDVGVGTGYFLDHCRFPTSSPRIGLMDLNQNALDYASGRIARYKPETYHRNVLEVISINSGKFDSVAMNLILHCIPGSIASKAVAFDHVKELLNPEAVIFGSTLLYDGVSSNWFAKRMMNIYNRKGIFSNRQDDLEGLTYELKQRFSDVVVETQGSVALFSARN